MGALLQILLRVIPAPSHDSDTEVDVDAQVETHWACAICGDVRVSENAHQNKDHHDDSGGVG
jgi:hypothetical protein